MKGKELALKYGLGEEEQCIKIYPWSRSVTGKFNNIVLNQLQEIHPEDIPQFISSQPKNIIISSIYEYIAHGNFFTAAMIARSIVSIHPDVQSHIQSYCPEWVSSMLYTWPDHTIPKDPSEFGPHLPFQFVQ